MDLTHHRFLVCAQDFWVTHAAWEPAIDPVTAGTLLWDQHSQPGRGKVREHRRGEEDEWEYLSHQMHWAKRRKEWELKIQIEDSARGSKNRWGQEHDGKGKSFPRRKETEHYAQHTQKCSLLDAQETEVKKSSQQSSLEPKVRKNQRKPFAADIFY